MTTMLDQETRSWIMARPLVSILDGQALSPASLGTGGSINPFRILVYTKTGGLSRGKHGRGKFAHGCRARASGVHLARVWIPAFVGMTSNLPLAGSSPM